MKAIFTLLIFISSFTSFSQSQDVVGDYEHTVETTKEKDLVEWKLTLKQDGTFDFHYHHYHSNVQQGFSPEQNIYGKGKWTIENNVVSFFSDKQKDLDEKYTLDFTNTKARFVVKSPRDKTDKIVKTKLMFLESGIFWMKRIDLFKI